MESQTQGAFRQAWQEAKNSFIEQETPDWVFGFRGPFADPYCDKKRVVKDWIWRNEKRSFFEWASRWDHVENIVIPSVAFDSSGRPEIRYALLLGDPSDSVNLAETNPAKDPQQFLPQGAAPSLPSQSDEAKWRAQRNQLTSAFLPGANLSRLVPVLQQGIGEMLGRWNQNHTVEACSELHHTALDLFSQGLLGIRLLPQTPQESKQICQSVAVEGFRHPELVSVRQEAVKRVLRSSGDVGPLLTCIQEIADTETQEQETALSLTAGHDTTAHTMTFILLELCRNPDVQEACRMEADRIASKLCYEGRDLRYSDLPEYEITTRVIMETLRLWGPVWTPLRRALTNETQFRGRDGLVAVPTGTSIYLWQFGHHISESLWGPTAKEFQPLTRAFHDQELQHGNLKTPASERFHPFSLPGRDCIGRNFAIMEMRMLLPALLRRFRLSLTEQTRMKLQNLQCGDGVEFWSLIDALPGPTFNCVRPLWLHLEPHATPGVDSKL